MRRRPIRNPEPDPSNGQLSEALPLLRDRERLCPPGDEITDAWMAELDHRSDAILTSLAWENLEAEAPHALKAMGVLPTEAAIDAWVRKHLDSHKAELAGE